VIAEQFHPPGVAAPHLPGVAIREDVVWHMLREHEKSGLVGALPA
jgi:hypothetical protein